MNKQVIDSIMEYLEEDTPEVTREYAFIRSELQRLLGDSLIIEKLMDHVQDAVTFGQEQAAQVGFVQGIKFL